jgi:hypothetical protein
MFTIKVAMVSHKCLPRRTVEQETSSRVRFEELLQRYRAVIAFM